MPLELHCPGCGRTLRIGDEHAGRQVRCPACQQISIAPGPTAPDSARTTGSSAAWHMRTKEGPVYGPVSWPQIESWVAEGRIASDCDLAERESGPWRSATEFFPALATGTPRPAQPPTLHAWTPKEAFVADNRRGDEPAGRATNRPSSAAPSTTGFVTPHRGGLILVLGLVGLLVGCPIFSLMAWVMGSSDLREMRSGRMDRSGEGLTQAGQLLGMIVSLFWIAGCVGFLLIILLAAVAGR